MLNIKIKMLPSSTTKNGSGKNMNSNGITSLGQYLIEAIKMSTNLKNFLSPYLK